MILVRKLVAISASLVMMANTAGLAYASEIGTSKINNLIAFAENEVTVTLDDSITITYKGENQVCYTEQGDVVNPATYNGTTYIPIRALSYILGIGVEWEGLTRTITINTDTAPIIQSPSGKSGDTGEVAATLDPGITVIYNDSKQLFRDVNNRQIDPLVYNGTTYLPIRGVSTMLNMQINWIQETQTVAITGEPSTSEVCTPCEYRAIDLLNKHYSGEAEGQYIVPFNGDTFEDIDIAGTTFSNQLFITSSYNKDNIYYFDATEYSKVKILAVASGFSEITSLVAVNPDTGEEVSIECQSMLELKAGSYTEDIANALTNMSTAGITPEQLQDMCSNLGSEVDITGWGRVGFYFTSTVDDTVTIMAAQLVK